MPDVAGRPEASETALWVERLTLTDFRNYTHLAHEFTAIPIVLTGANGAGKTNLLEAVSLLAPGQGLRRQPFAELTRVGVSAGWSVAARVHSAAGGMVEIGTGVSIATSQRERTGRIVRIDRETQTGSGVLAEHVKLVWLTPAMDSLFTGPAGDRRRFLDRLIVCFDPGYRRRVSDFERAMRQRNRLLETGAGAAEFDALELIMAETGVGIAAARVEAVAQLAAAISERCTARPESPFPWQKSRCKVFWKKISLHVRRSMWRMPIVCGYAPVANGTGRQSVRWTAHIVATLWLAMVQRHCRARCVRLVSRRRFWSDWCWLMQSLSDRDEVDARPYCCLMK